jgi:microcystin-dependent protein
MAIVKAIKLINGVFREISQTDSIYSQVPVGVVHPFAGSTAPDGWLLCDGSAVSRTTYADLFSVIGTIYGSGDGSTTFNLPDMRGIFPKGAGTTNRAAGKDANGNYYSAILGAYNQDRMQGHWHSWYPDDTAASTPPPSTYAPDGSSFVRAAGSGVADRAMKVGYPKSDGSNGTPRTGPATEPQNLGLNFIIKI